MSLKLEQRILDYVGRSGYQALKPKALARRLQVPAEQYLEFRQTLKGLVRKGQLQYGKKHTLQPATPWTQVVGVYRPIRKGGGFVRPKPGQGKDLGDIFIKAKNASDAAGGDVVLVAVLKVPKLPGRAPTGTITEIIERASHHFVGTYFTSADEGFVRVDGGIFHEAIYVGDAGAKGARPDDKVVFEMLRFPSPEMTGEGVITEVLGARGQPGVDLLSVVREFHLPDQFSESVLAEAREQARLYSEAAVADDRLSLTEQTVVTIDPDEARDFDDAVSLDRDENGHWRLGVHIADVALFVRPGTPLDEEARRRGTSVYLPGKVLPMLPELISNGLASLQAGRPRYTKSVFVDFDPEGHITGVEFANSVVCVRARLTYGQVTQLYDRPGQQSSELSPEVVELLLRMRELASLLRERRRRRGVLELTISKPELRLDEQGCVCEIRFGEDQESHQVIEEFMLTANEAVAQRLAQEGVSFLRRVHEMPDPHKLQAFAEFARSLGIRLDDYRSRFEIQSLLREVAGKPVRHAVHQALLRSLKLAVYSPDEEGHYALASEHYCHFTSPIRRYPDLTIHRILDQLLRTGKAGSDAGELLVLGEHCSLTERRAEKAERELVKIKLLTHIADRVGEEMEMLITGVEEFGFFAQGIPMPVEGLVHVRTLTDDLYTFDLATHSLVGKRSGRRYQLGMTVRCVIWKVDLHQRELDLRVAKRPISKGKGKANAATKKKVKAKPRTKSRAKTKRRPKRNRPV